MGGLDHSVAKEMLLFLRSCFGAQEALAAIKLCVHKLAWTACAVGSLSGNKLQLERMFHVLLHKEIYVRLNKAVYINSPGHLGHKRLKTQPNGNWSCLSSQEEIFVMVMQMNFLLNPS